MNLQAYPHASTPARASHDLGPAKDLELVRLLWPDLTPIPTGMGPYRILIECVVSTFNDLYNRFGIPTTQSTAALATLIKERTSTRSVVATTVQQHFTNAKITEAPRRAFLSILRLWTMLDVQLEAPRYSPGIPVWLENEGITDATKRFFDQQVQSEEAQGLPLTIDEALTAANLVQNYRIKIVPTDNLAEHLTIDSTRKRRTLKVFEHKVWVLNHLTFPDTSPIPFDVLEELMGTFSLLFPNFDRATESLLEGLDMAESFYALGTCARDRSLEWSDYKYWRKAVLQLNNVLVNEAPQGARQLLRVDNKDKNSLLNLILFWVSGMVAVLAIVSTVCGAWAVNLAIRALDVSVQSMDISIRGLDLSIAQACMDPDVAAKLPQFCPGPT